MFALRRRLVDNALARRIAGAAVRGLIESENAVWLSTWPYRSTPGSDHVDLTICMVAGAHRAVFVRAVIGLVEDLPPGVEIVVADHGVARYAKRMLSDFGVIRYVAPRTAQVTTGALMNDLVATARGATVLFISPDTVANRHVVARAVELARAKDRPFPAFAGSVFDGRGDVVEARSPCDPASKDGGGDTSGLRALARHEQAGESTGASRAALVVDRSLLEFVGGFDERASDTALEDLCERFIGVGARIGFDPRLAIIDLDSEGATHRRRRERRVDRGGSRPGAGESGEQWRPGAVDGKAHAGRNGDALQILLIEDRVPHPELGQGYPRSDRILRALDAADHRVVFYPLQDPAESIPSIFRDLPRRIAVLRALGIDGMPAFLASHGESFDLIIVARPHNMRIFRDAVDRLPAALSKALPPVVYDAEAINAARDILQGECRGEPITAAAAEELIEREIALGIGCALVVAVSDGERVQFERRGIEPVLTLGHAADPCPTPMTFDSRRDFLFVGALIGPDTPNSDGLTWFVQHVWPLVREGFSHRSPRLLVAGKLSDAVRPGLEGDGVDLLGTVANLEPLYDRCRVFISPARYSSGIPLKVIDAARHGVPVVATTQAAAQLEWIEGRDLLTADRTENFASQCIRLHEDRVLWQNLRGNALCRIEAQASVAAFRDRVDEIVRVAMRGRP